MTHEQLLRIYWAANPEMKFSPMIFGFGKGSLIDSKYGEVHILNIAPFSHIATLSKDLKSMLCFYSTEFLKPHLKPLSSITDEDAIAVAKMAIGVNESSRLYSWALKKRGVVLGSPSPSIAGEVFEFAIDEFKWSLSVYLHNICHGERDVNNPWEITDYLRSKSYNLDFEPENFIAI